MRFKALQDGDGIIALAQPEQALQAQLEAAQRADIAQYGFTSHSIVDYDVRTMSRDELVAFVQALLASAPTIGSEIDWCETTQGGCAGTAAWGALAEWW